MPYATLADMLKRFNDEGMAILAGDEDGVLNEAEINASLSAATEEADSYLRARVRLPLSTIPEVLVGYVCDLARYRLADTEENRSETIIARRTDALNWLKDVAAGRASLPATTSGSSETSSPSIKVIPGGEKVFTQNAMDKLFGPGNI
jgi:phage gp36-like protein